MRVRIASRLPAMARLSCAACRVAALGGFWAEAMCHDAERRSGAAGRLDAALPMPLHHRRLASRARAGLRYPVGAWTTNGCRGAVGYGPGRGGRLCCVPSRAEPWALVLAGTRAPS